MNYHPAALLAGETGPLLGVPDPDEASPIAIAAYFGAYGPATLDAVAA